MEQPADETKTSTDPKPSEEEKKTESPPINSAEPKPQSSAKPPPIRKPATSEDAKSDESNDELHNTQILNKNYDEVVELDESCAQSFATPRNLSVPGSRKASIVGAKAEGETKKNDPLNRSYDETVELSHAAESIDSRIASPGNDKHIRIDTNNTEKYKDNNNNNNISPNSHSNSRQNLEGTGGSLIGGNNTGKLSETKTSTEEGYNESLQNTANSEFGSTTFSQPPNIFNESGNINNNKNNTGGAKSNKSGGAGSMGDNESNDDINDSADDEDDKSISLPHASSSKGYNAGDYAHLNVNKEVRELFQYISQYKPPDLTLDVKMVCFVPEYLPSIGQIDTFIKVPRPDGKPDGLGLTQLDEPATVESDRTVLELQLRAISKKKNNDPITIRSIENAEKNPERIQQWIDSVMDIHKSKPSPQVHYSKPMPDMEILMEQWSTDFEESLKSVEFPSSEIDLSLNDYSRLACAIMDIPIYDKNNKNNSVIEGLHCLFSLYESYNEIPNFACKNPPHISE